MPVKVSCHGCGAILYESIEIKPPDEVAQRYFGKCPKCGRKLGRNPMTVDVKPALGQKPWSHIRR